MRLTTQACPRGQEAHPLSFVRQGRHFLGEIPGALRRRPAVPEDRLPQAPARPSFVLGELFQLTVGEPRSV